MDRGQRYDGIPLFMTVQESSIMMAYFSKIDLPKYSTSRRGLDMFDCSKGALEFRDGVLKTTHCEVEVLNLLSDGFDSKALVDINHEHLFSNRVGINAEDLFSCSEGIIVMCFESLVD